MHSKAALVLAIVALAVAAPAVSAGELEVQVVNRTANAPPPPALAVVLHTYANGQEVGREEATTDSRRRAVFRGLAPDEGNTYVVEVSYQGVKYDSGPIQLTEASRKATVELPVYETTASPDAVQVQVQHTVLRPQRGALEVEEMFVIRNPTDRTYIGQGEVKPGLRRVIEFVLPAGFTDVQLGQGIMPCCIVAEGNGFVDTMEVKPGPRRAQFKYLLPYTGPRLTFRPSFLAPTQQYSLLVSPALRVSRVSGLEPVGDFNAGGEAYQSYAATNLAPSMAASIELSGLPADRTRLLRYLALALAGSLALLLAWWVLRSRRQPAAQTSPDDLADQRRRLLEEIAQLDELFESGKLPRVDYQLVRKSKKAELATLSRRPSRLT